MPREYMPVPKAELPKMQQLDRATEQVYDLRESLVRLLIENKKYFPLSKDGKPVSITELVKMTENRPVEELMDWQTLTKEAEADGQRPDEVKQKKKVILRAIKRAIEHQRTLDRAYQEWPGAPEELTQHMNMRLREFGLAQRRLGEFSKQETEETALLDSMTIKSGAMTQELSEAMADQREEIREIREKRDNFVLTSPEAYYVEVGREMRNMKQTFDQAGTIVETPYVKEKIQKIMEDIAVGMPVFIHGELGSGKSELARHLARTRLSAPHLMRWEKSHPRPESQDKKALAKWSADRERESEAIEIAGHRGMEAEPFLAERTIALREVPTPEEQMDIVEQNWAEKEAEIKKRKQEDGQPLSKKDLKEYRKYYEQAYLQSFRNPVESRRALGPLFRAMQEGRPLLVDEMNAIPHHALIVMNDYLRREPGQVVSPPFPDMEPFKVAEGFCVLATGNYKPEDGEFYAGRQKVDAAYLSRFGVVNYDYLPGARELEGEGKTPEDQRKFRRENELLQMMVTRLLQDNLSLAIPAGDWPKLEKLAIVARSIQDIFSGAEMSRNWYTEKGSKPQEVLKENVLSLRHLLPIIDKWSKKDGYRYPLDIYVFSDYVERSKGARPKEMLYLYRQLQVVGDFFPPQQGWPDSSQPDFANALSKFKVSDIKKKYDTGQATIQRQTMSARQVMDKLFGPPPERTLIIKEEEKNVEANKVKPRETDEQKLERARAQAMLRELAKSAQEMNGEDFGQDFAF